MAVVGSTSARKAQRLRTRERLMGAAIAEFKRSGLTSADVGTIVSAAGVAHGTFYFHFPTKEHVLVELELRESERIARQLVRFASTGPDVESTLREAIRLVLVLEQRLGAILFKEFLALHFSQTRPADSGPDQQAVIIALAAAIERAKSAGGVDASGGIEPIAIAASDALIEDTLRWAREGGVR